MVGSRETLQVKHVRVLKKNGKRGVFNSTNGISECLGKDNSRKGKKKFPQKDEYKRGAGKKIKYRKRKR